MLKHQEYKREYQTFTVTISEDWYVDNPGYATIAEWLEHICAEKFGDHVRSIDRLR